MTSDTSWPSRTSNLPSCKHRIVLAFCWKVPVFTNPMRMRPRGTFWGLVAFWPPRNLCAGPPGLPPHDHEAALRRLALSLSAIQRRSGARLSPPARALAPTRDRAARARADGGSSRVARGDRALLRARRTGQDVADDGNRPSRTRAVPAIAAPDARVLRSRNRPASVRAGPLVER